MLLSAQSITSRSAAGAGMASALAGSMLIATLDALAKLLTGSMGIAEIMLYRGALIGAVLAVVILAGGERRRLRSARPRLTLLRAGLAFATSVLIVIAFRHLPLADALALFFVNPLIVAVLSRPLLGEPVGRRNWMAVAAGFAGALQDIVTRRLQGHDHPQTILLYTMAVSTLAGAALTLSGGPVHRPTSGEWALLGASAAAGLGAYYCLILAYQLAPPARVAPLRYTTLVWAALYGFLIWGHVPDTTKLLGAAIVTGSGLFLLRDARRRPGGALSPTAAADACAPRSRV